MMEVVMVGLPLVAVLVATVAGAVAMKETGIFTC